jgi:hypothetical protein
VITRRVLLIEQHQRTEFPMSRETRFLCPDAEHCDPDGEGQVSGRSVGMVSRRLGRSLR